VSRCSVNSTSFWRRRTGGDGPGPVGDLRLRHPVRDGSVGEDGLPADRPAPATWCPRRSAKGEGQPLQPLQGLDLRLQLLDAPGRRGRIQHLLLEGLDLVVGSLLQVLPVLFIQGRTGASELGDPPGPPAGASPAPAAGSPGVPGADGGTGRWPPAKTPAAVAGW
jgi:hypothetical protein